MKKFTQTSTDLYEVDMGDVTVFIKMEPDTDIELDTPEDQHNPSFEYCLWYFSIAFGKRTPIRCIPYSTIAHYTND